MNPMKRKRLNQDEDPSSLHQDDSLLVESATISSSEISSGHMLVKLSPPRGLPFSFPPIDDLNSQINYNIEANPEINSNKRLKLDEPCEMTAEPGASITLPEVDMPVKMTPTKRVLGLATPRSILRRVASEDELEDKNDLFRKKMGMTSRNRSLCFSPMPKVNEYDVDSPATRRLEVKKMPMDTLEDETIFKELLIRGVKLNSVQDVTNSGLKYRKLLAKMFITEFKSEFKKYDLDYEDSNADMTLEKSQEKHELLQILLNRVFVFMLYGQNGDPVSSGDVFDSKLPINMSNEQLLAEIAKRKINIADLNNRESLFLKGRKKIFRFSEESKTRSEPCSELSCASVHEQENERIESDISRKILIQTLECAMLKEASGMSIPGYEFGKTLITSEELVEAQYLMALGEDAMIDDDEFQRETRKVENVLKNKFRCAFIDVLQKELIIRDLDSFDARKQISVRQNRHRQPIRVNSDGIIEAENEQALGFNDSIETGNDENADAAEMESQSEQSRDGCSPSEYSLLSSDSYLSWNQSETFYTTKQGENECLADEEDTENDEGNDKEDIRTMQQLFNILFVSGKWKDEYRDLEDHPFTHAHEVKSLLEKFDDFVDDDNASGFSDSDDIDNCSSDSSFLSKLEFFTAKSLERTGKCDSDKSELDHETSSVSPLL